MVPYSDSKAPRSAAMLGSAGSAREKSGAAAKRRLALAKCRVLEARQEFSKNPSSGNYYGHVEEPFSLGKDGKARLGKRGHKRA